MRKWKMMCCTAALLAVALVTPACALECTYDGPEAGDFGTPASDSTIYERNDPHVDKGKSGVFH